MKIFIIDFSRANLIAEKLNHQFKVFIEKKDGGNAYRQVAELMPDVIFVNYKDKPSHGRQTAQSIKERKKTSQIPIFFVNGDEKENEKISHIGVAITMDEIENFIPAEKKIGC